MTDEADAPPPAPAPKRRPVLRALGWLAAALLLIVAVAIYGVDTSVGHRLITDRIAALKIKTGLRIRVGRIDGSIWTHAVLRDVRLYDLDGQFFSAPEIKLDWHPLEWARNQLSIDDVSADLVRLARLPRLRKTTNAPLIPNFDIRIGHLAIGKLEMGKSVAGSLAEARIGARADIRDRRAMIGLLVATNKGDRVVLDMDASPDADRFALAGHADGPEGGVLGGLFGSRRPVHLAIGGKGGWHVWHGRAAMTLANRPVADLALAAHEGRYGLAGFLAPSPFLQGKLQRLTDPRLKIAGEARLADRKLNGRLAILSPELALKAAGTIDLAQSSFAPLAIDLNLLQPRALFPNMTGQDIRLRVDLKGPFKTAEYRYALTAPHLAFDNTGFDNVRATGADHIRPLPLPLPLKLQAQRVTGIGAVAGGILANLSVQGILNIDAKTIQGKSLALNSDKLKGKLGLLVDLVTGKFNVALSGGLTRYLIPGLGIVDVDSEVTVVPTADGHAAIVQGKGRADVRRFDNAFLRSLVGGLPHLTTDLVRNPDGTIRFTNLVLTGPQIRITGVGLRRRDGSFQFAGKGVQTIYGPFRLNLDGMIDHPRIDLLLDHPVDALGLANVRVNLDPTPQGFAFKTAGASYLGPFAGNGAILTPPGGLTTISVAALDVSGTRAHGSLLAKPTGLDGRLDVNGGGIGGTLQISPQGTIQKIEPHLAFSGAHFAAATPIDVRRGRLDGTILLDPTGTRLKLTAGLAGVKRNGFELARLGLGTDLAGGRGPVSLVMAGAGGRSFAINATANLQPQHISVKIAGQVDQQTLSAPKPAELSAQGSGWSLAPFTLGYGGGSATVSATFGDGPNAFDLVLDRLPLNLIDVVMPKLGLTGQVSGRAVFQVGRDTAPSGHADLTVRGLTRSGLTLASQPIDLGLNAALTPQALAMRAVAASGGHVIGRAQARMAPFPSDPHASDRFGRAPLFAQLRYNGPGDTLWRLIGVPTINLSGPLAVAADVGGTLDNPQIKGTLSTSAGKLESSATGTVVQNIRASGRFDGSRLILDQMAGTTAGGGQVSGRGAFDFSNARGVGIDIALDTRDAQLLNRDDIAATVTGPLTIKSDGIGGTIAGTFALSKGRYRLGSAAAAQVAHLNVVDVNQPDDVYVDAAPTKPWTLDIKANAFSRLMVTGLGLDSEWRAKLTIKGAVDNPAIGGSADLVQGNYQFAGRKFDLSRGVIRFSGVAPPDPILDITANANLQGLNASIHVSGTGLHPDISFESTPALPEDELLSRLLFGTSITNLSAPEALQLATAVASLRSSGSGGGLNLDPINAVRKAVHLDRLRIVPADITTGQKTSVAAGKYIGRRTYVELITDGAGYSATSVEFRITRWLSLLSTISTIGRQSAGVRISKDY
ncbi:translocation and assembly module TamB [Sphingomonas vulcanisoli]|uniref:Translocation and assembly module TamB n=1 Tax=Sphingomonas vulcanisoli TaxID=1658060 RepID=A0ABX0TR79_9SPHN|nr:translocation/assembly module TamB domain-containing protein [Sphingomonas vulcanisoli]NIJ08033.1 translocation and assembly module TamB [Sphingomonas vulcanisoli]